MCGIVGFSGNSSIESNLSLLRASRDTLQHRGPDAFGEFYDDTVYLGHRRLSIIDLSEGSNQPLKSSHEPVHIVFNGEIYNYKELSVKVENLTTKSDTEVILEGYIQYGTDFFKLLRGIYAFAIYDTRDRPQIILYRDLAGVKPLYFSFINGEFIFASEIKAIRHLKERLVLNEGVLKCYLSLGYCIEPETIYRDVNVVEPGQCIILNLIQKRLSSFILNRYDIHSINGNSFTGNQMQVKELLKRAVDRNKVADVPILFSLSGGIDSSLVFAYGTRSSNDHAICVSFNDPLYDETDIALTYGKVLQKSVDLVSSDICPDLALLDKILLHFDQPYADSSAIPFYMLAKRASELTKVLIGGDGGDEVHNGYPSFGLLPQLVRLGNFRNIISWLAKNTSFLSDDRVRQLTRIYKLTGFENYDDLICEWQAWIPPSTMYRDRSPFKYDVSEIFAGFSKSFEGIDAVNLKEGIVKSYFYKRMLSDYLRKADMMSMISGVEYRVPMLDEDLVAFSFSIPYSQKSSLLNQKKILRYIHKGIFPKATSSLIKKGFGIPLDKWIREEDFDRMRNVILDRNGIVLQFIEEKYVLFLFSALKDTTARKSISRVSVYQRILIMYSLQLWYFKSYLKNIVDA